MNIGKAMLITCLLPLSLLYPQEGRAIMEQLQEANDPQTSHALVRMELLETDGSVKERIIEEWSDEDEQGLARSVIVFHRPTSVQNTRFLVIENSDREDDQWIFLPALKRVRRIASSEGGDSFMGTEFSYDDFKSREIDDYTHTYLRTENAQGYRCHVVESVPKEGTGSRYGRILHWITVDEEIMSDLKMELYDRDGSLARTFLVEDLKQVDGYWTPVSVIMKNSKTGRATRLVQERLELDKPVNPRRFTTRYLQTGRTE
jgi:Outer membrane lipoprotein-sorting protein